MLWLWIILGYLGIGLVSGRIFYVMGEDSEGINELDDSPGEVLAATVLWPFLALLGIFWVSTMRPTRKQKQIEREKRLKAEHNKALKELGMSVEDEESKPKPKKRNRYVEAEIYW